VSAAAPGRASVPEAPPRIRVRRDDDIKVELNNTSMTDVIFILLIFFISLSQIRTSAVDVKLPTVSGNSRGAGEEGRRVVIDVSKENGIFLDGARVEPADLGARIAALRAPGEEEPKVRIRSDEQSRSGRLVEVIAALADAGIAKVEFGVRVGPRAAQGSPR
jgi:biopolymer transport protein ExbD